MGNAQRADRAMDVEQARRVAEEKHRVAMGQLESNADLKTVKALEEAERLERRVEIFIMHRRLMVV